MPDAQPGQAQPQPPSGAQPGQPPFGSSPATGPTQNKGQEAAAAKILAVATDGLMLAAQLVGPTSDAGRGILEAIQKIAKLVPPGSVTPQDKMKVMQQLTMAAQKGAQQMSQMRPGGAPPQPGAPQPGQPQAAPQQMPAHA